MDLFDFFFPEQAQASHLRKISKQGSIQSGAAQGREQSSEIKALQADVKFLTLVIAAMLRRMSETESASLADIQGLLDEIDALDGASDGGLDPGVLRGLLGVLKQSGSDQDDGAQDEFNIVTTPRYRKR